MAKLEALAPSDILTSTSDELGDALAAVRGQALSASGEQRKELFDLYKKLIRRQQRIMLLDLQAIDKDPAIDELIDQLSTFSQQLAKAKREMTKAKQTIDSATKVLGILDQVFGIVGKFVV